jgi:dihydrolipoamide dehydrogenase
MARLTGQISGFVKIVASADSGRICGGVVVGPHATEVIHEIAIAMRHGLTVAQVADTIHAHPTFAEAVGEAALSWLGFPLHSL